MKTLIIKLWDDFRTGFWFVPSLVIISAVVLALALPELDDWLGSATPDWIQSDPDTARATLTTVGSAMITVAGVVFSVTMVTLSITSSQFGPRLLRSFLSDPVSQFALGCCLGSSLYCLLLLRSLHKTDDGFFVPHLSIFLGVLMSAVTVGVLIYFIHHISCSIQADNVVAHVAHDLDSAIERLFPEKVGEGGSHPTHEHEHDLQRLKALESSSAGAEVTARQEGYLQAVDDEGLMSLATEHDLVIQLEHRPGDFVMSGNLLAIVYPTGNFSNAAGENLRDAFLVGNRRTPRQDVECAVVELVELAVRALSPGINDPFTAIRCIDRLGASLGRLSEREIPLPFRYDKHDQLRVIVRGWDFGEVLEAAYNMIRQHGATNVAVSIRLLESLKMISTHVFRDADRQAIARQARMIVAGFERYQSEGEDWHAICNRYDQLTESLGIESTRDSATWSAGPNVSTEPESA